MYQPIDNTAYALTCWQLCQPGDTDITHMLERIIPDDEPEHPLAIYDLTMAIIDGLITASAWTTGTPNQDAMGRVDLPATTIYWFADNARTEWYADAPDGWPEEGLPQ